MSRQPIPGEVWTHRYTPDEFACVTALSDHPEWAVWWNERCDRPFIDLVDDFIPPPELPPAELVASVRMWVNVYPTGWSVSRSEAEGETYASPARIWLIRPDGRWQKCNGKEVIGEPVEVPR